MCRARSGACHRACGTRLPSISFLNRQRVQTMNTQFGLVNLWTQGDLITKSVAVLLLAMSLATWMVIIIKALDLRKNAAQARATESFWHAADFADGLNKLGPERSNPFRALALEGREATAHHHAQQPQLHDSLDVSE